MVMALTDPQFKELMNTIIYLAGLVLLGWVVWCATKVDDE